MIGKISVNSVDTYGKKYQESVGYTSQEIATNTTVAAVFDRFGRAIVRLTNNTYDDTTVTYEVSVNQVIADAD